MYTINSLLNVACFGKRLARSRQGNAAVEFAFILPFLTMLLVGAVNFGMLFEEEIRISSAAHAGAHYGAQTMSHSLNTNGIVAAARDDAKDSSNELTVAANRYCICPGETSEVACNTSCTGSENPYTYVTVAVSHEVNALLPFPGFQDSTALSQTVSMRVR